MSLFSANLNFLFNEHDFMDRFEAAAKFGFRFVEFMFPYDYDIDQIREKITQNKLKLVLINLPAGDWAAGDRGIAADPDRVNEYRAAVPKAVEAAKKLGVDQVNCLVGKVAGSHSPVKIKENLAANLTFTADVFAEAGIRLLIEPINRYDIPGFVLNTTNQVIEILDAIKKSNAFLQYDIYHAARENEDLDGVITKHIAKIGHVQIADNPGRNEPGTGKIPVKDLMKKLEIAGYKGYLGLEYKPSSKTEESLYWIKNIGRTL
ncbi:TIM barrel protein [Marispirochaeta sp.]|uniref:TIM barrel protein n=1 Tax=Marispirochaeta sp. TaxID=2038653 RepID=UPI0029C98637|nr:TIM barrel protein [Marispirochaeta sp.]